MQAEKKSSRWKPGPQVLQDGINADPLMDVDPSGTEEGSMHLHVKVSEPGTGEAPLRHHSLDEFDGGATGQQTGKDARSSSKDARSSQDFRDLLPRLNTDSSSVRSNAGSATAFDYRLSDRQSEQIEDFNDVFGFQEAVNEHVFSEVSSQDDMNTASSQSHADSLSRLQSLCRSSEASLLMSLDSANAGVQDAQVAGRLPHSARLLHPGSHPGALMQPEIFRLGAHLPEEDLYQETQDGVEEGQTKPPVEFSIMERVLTRAHVQEKWEAANPHETEFWQRQASKSSEASKEETMNLKAINDKTELVERSNTTESDAKAAEQLVTLAYDVLIALKEKERAEELLRVETTLFQELDVNNAEDGSAEEEAPLLRSSPQTIRSHSVEEEVLIMHLQKKALDGQDEWRVDLESRLHSIDLSEQTDAPVAVEAEIREFDGVSDEDKDSHNTPPPRRRPSKWYWLECLDVSACSMEKTTCSCASCESCSQASMMVSL